MRESKPYSCILKTISKYKNTVLKLLVLFVHFPLYSGFKSSLGLPAESSAHTTITWQLAPNRHDQLEIKFDSKVTDYLPLHKVGVKITTARNGTGEKKAYRKRSPKQQLGN